MPRSKQFKDILRSHALVSARARVPQGPGGLMRVLGILGPGAGILDSTSVILGILGIFGFRGGTGPRDMFVSLASWSTT